MYANELYPYIGRPTSRIPRMHIIDHHVQTQQAEAGAQLGGRERGLEPPWPKNGGHTIIPDSMSFFGGGG